jgi:hypothetical protein
MEEQIEFDFNEILSQYRSGSGDFQLKILYLFCIFFKKNNLLLI